ncbi:MAG: arylesterase [Methyloceanibacter sp.]|uniref:arylesterase n=1 Tax=Methyloceanibacter sp. TaxID=1965321 RepID=UPI003D9B61B1
MTALVLFAAASFGAVGMHSSQAEPKGTVIVALGDSLTAGYGLEQSQAFPVQLERALEEKGYDVSVVNAGVSGDTVAAGLKRLDWALPPDADAVIIELGGNDALQGLPPEQIKASLEKIITQVQAKGLPILLAGMEAPRNMGKTYTDEFRAVFADLAQEYDLVFYPFFLEGAAMTDGMMQGDGIHASDKGVARIVEGILPKVEELLARVKAKG